MTWKEFSELLKFVVVQAAAGHYGIKDRPANASQVSSVIDIDRKNVKRQHELLVVDL